MPRQMCCDIAAWDDVREVLFACYRNHVDRFGSSQERQGVACRSCGFSTPVPCDNYAPAPEGLLALAVR